MRAFVRAVLWPRGGFSIGLMKAMDQAQGGRQTAPGGHPGGPRMAGASCRLHANMCSSCLGTKDVF
eukprot:971736-Pyramimonas_sp.AAC.1